MTPSFSDPTPDFASPGAGTMRASKLNIALLCLALLSIGGALYLSPVAASTDADTPSASPTSPTAPQAQVPGSGTLPTPSPTTTASPKPKQPSPPPSSGGTGSGGLSSSALVQALYRGDGTGLTPRKGGAAAPAGKATSSHATTIAKTKCWQFTWQQDAQKVYEANLSDPYGLDGAPGPNDSDGIACSSIKVDPSRPASKPVGAYQPPKPSPATKSALVNPAKDYFGVSQDGLPGDTAMFDQVTADAGKAPSAVGWFSSFDQTYRADLVTQAWSRGALPVVTWLPMASSSDTSYSLTSIINGTHDAYLRRFAGDVVRTDLPVVIRLGHEMNGSWYGWSAGRTDWNNSPEKYVAAWRHIWQVFDGVGANENVIWLWSPSRVDNLKPTATNGLTTPAQSYPGDSYVDWVGASVYLRDPATGPTFAASFGKTVDALAAITDKPIFFAETGAIESDGGTDEAELKAAWIHDSFSAIAANRRLVGFLWFNNVASTVVDGQEVDNDWRFTSSPQARAQFRKDIAVSQFSAGTPPDQP
jgi:mannan endo-1,4-beta-mannosidase